MLKGALILSARLLLFAIGFSILWVVAYRFINPPATYLMLRDRVQGVAVNAEWVGLDGISASLPRSVIAAEDSQFCAHHGFDFAAIEKAWARNQAGGRLRGGSTISQQVAKNVFLWPGRTMVRKGAEAWFTFWTELIWDKKRIMEAYLNVAEFGRGIYGAEAAAHHYFSKSARQLTATEAARLAAILPQPRKRSAATPGPYTRRYAGQIAARANVVKRDALDACLY